MYVLLAGVQLDLRPMWGGGFNTWSTTLASNLWDPAWDSAETSIPQTHLG